MIRFANVDKEYPSGKRGVTSLSFTVEKGETLVFLGQSGSGKTTALRLINRLIEPTSGEIFIEGTNIQDVDPITLRRGIGYAFQHIGLFPHMTVAENIAIVPKLLNWSEHAINQRVEELLLMVDLDPTHFSPLYPENISGGQKQRVGVARALAGDPPIVLMDEPFGALDPTTRLQLQDQFLEIQSQLQKTVIFVTHDHEEAIKMGNRIAILEEGKLINIFKPKETTDALDHLRENLTAPAR
jgi:osmoprotectant transport system ATP-binding protein